MSEIITSKRLFKAEVDMEGPVNMSGTTSLGGVALTATAAEINSSLDGNTATAAELVAKADNSVIAAKVVPSAVITASATSVQTSIEQSGDIIKTTIAIDLAGLKSTTTENDIIGNTGVSYLAPITSLLNGVIIAGQVRCGEAPATGVTDIDLAFATAATGAYDADVTGLAGYAALMTAGGAHAIGTTKNLTALPTSGYLYLSAGAAGTPGTYSAGKLFIELWGTVA